MLRYIALCEIVKCLYKMRESDRQGTVPLQRWVLFLTANRLLSDDLTTQLWLQCANINLGGQVSF